MRTADEQIVKQLSFAQLKVCFIGEVRFTDKAPIYFDHNTNPLAKASLGKKFGGGNFSSHVLNLTRWESDF